MNASPLSTNKVLRDPVYPRLKQSLIGWTGLAYYLDKDAELAGQIARRMPIVEAATCDSYLSHLENGATGQSELDALIADLTIGETFFFRHQEMFDALRTIVIPDVLARNHASRQLRIWSAGCSTGAEAYTISMLLRREMAAEIEGWNITIIGTDINRTFLTTVREGNFEEWAFRSTSDNLKRACFTQNGNAWRINPEFKQGVSFQYHNLVTHPCPSHLNNFFAFDVIFCRNVTIYFSHEIVQQLLGHFRCALVDGGWLLVGHAEPNIELFREFRTVNVPGAILYQRSDGLEPKAPFGIRAFELPATKATSGAWNVDIAERLSAIAPQAPADEHGVTVSAAPQNAEIMDVDTLREHADRGDWEQAATVCSQLLNTDKLNPRIYYYQALVQEQMGRHTDAEHSLRRVIYLDRTFILGHYYLGLLLQKVGRAEQSTRSFQNVLQLLTRVEAEHKFADGDGISAAELRKLTEMQLAILGVA